ncbi:hypothetical protein AYI68_g6669 [Smittium mucronatum]|uniref:Uncharacterized protein n=1 Tax=Smittium mucronatum TaxID=133383 RepID=A0A1R0GQV6_9FUNG|nr:hypothetical protein AYI68_g6669 [Smittium mucronatum]
MKLFLGEGLGMFEIGTEICHEPENKDNNAVVEIGAGTKHKITQPKPTNSDSNSNSDGGDGGELAGIRIWGPVILYCLLSVVLTVVAIIYKKNVSQQLLSISEFLKGNSVSSSIYVLCMQFPARVGSRHSRHVFGVCSWIPAWVRARLCGRNVGLISMFSASPMDAYQLL